MILREDEWAGEGETGVDGRVSGFHRCTVYFVKSL